MEEQLVYDTIQELAEALGHSNYNPLSTSLLCLGHGITFEEKGKIMVAFVQVLNTTAFEDLTVVQFRTALERVVPSATTFADTVVIAFIKAFARNYIAELVPFARTLD